MTQSEYQRRVKALRSETSHWQRVTNERVQTVLDKSYNDLTELLQTKTKTSLTRDFVRGRKKRIENIMDQMSLGTRQSIEQGMYDASTRVGTRYRETTKQFIRDEGFTSDWDKMFTTVPYEAVGNVLNRVWSDGFTFSDRVWKLNQQSKAGVAGILGAGIARGQSAVQMSKELRRFMKDSALTPGLTWTTGVKKSVTGRGTIHYNALRLARSEINNTYRETMVLSNQRSRVTNGVKWHLSGSHPRSDVCNLWAEGDSYGMGIGITPANATPIDHPNGLCYMTDVIRKPQDWNKPKSQPSQKPIPKAKQNKILSGLTAGLQNSALKMFNGTRKQTNLEGPRVRRDKLLNSPATSQRDYACRLLIERQYTDQEIVDRVHEHLPGGKAPFTRVQVIKMRRFLNKGTRKGYEPLDVKLVEIITSQGDKPPTSIVPPIVPIKGKKGKVKSDVAIEAEMLEKYSYLRQGSVVERKMVRAFETMPSNLMQVVTKSKYFTVNANTNKEVAHYSTRSKGIHITTRDEIRTYRHEFGHHIYQTSLSIDDAKKLLQLRQDFQVKLRAADVKTQTGVGTQTTNNIRYRIRKDINGKDSYVNDYFGALTKNEMGYGHTMTYYGESISNRNHEMFANLTDVYSHRTKTPAGWNSIKEHTPEIANWFEKTMNRIAASKD